MALLDELLELNESDMYPFHMPGHKRNKNAGRMSEFYGIDITEIDGFDDLHNPEGLIKDMAAKAADIYGSKYAFLSVNGSTAANEAAILATVATGDEILIPRGCHKSVYYAIELSGARPIYILPKVFEDSSIIKPVTPVEIENALVEHPNCKAVVITSPTYEGAIADVKAISEIVHSYGGILIVDCAHGAHLGLDECVPQSPAQNGADLIIISLHKMLPSPTQTGLLLVCSDLVDVNRVKHYMSVFQSSSPSYILMAGIGEAIDYIGAEARVDLKQAVARIEALKAELKDLKTITVMFPEDGHFETDPFKLVIRTVKKGITGRLIYDLLRERFHLQCEMCGEEYALVLFSVMDTQEGFDRLKNALRQIDDYLLTLPKADSNKIDTFCFEDILPRKHFEIKEAKRKPAILVDIDEAVDRISADYILAYPPGIPFAVPGEFISSELVKYIKQSLQTGINIVGLKDNQVLVIK